MLSLAGSNLRSYLLSSLLISWISLSLARAYVREMQVSDSYKVSLAYLCSQTTCWISMATNTSPSCHWRYTTFLNLAITSIIRHKNDESPPLVDTHKEVFLILLSDRVTCHVEEMERALCYSVLKTCDKQQLSIQRQHTFVIQGRSHENIVFHLSWGHHPR
ncbi:hypothetical protein KCU93_g383, partial [Aureobasidium melanogenum]